MNKAQCTWETEMLGWEQGQTRPLRLWQGCWFGF